MTLLAKRRRSDCHVAPSASTPFSPSPCGSRSCAEHRRARRSHPALARSLREHAVVTTGNAELRLAESGIKEGALLRRIRKGAHLGELLAPAALRDIVKERYAMAGWPGGGVAGSFSAHSLRAGFVTEAGPQNMSLPRRWP